MNRLFRVRELERGKHKPALARPFSAPDHDSSAVSERSAAEFRNGWAEDASVDEAQARGEHDGRRAAGVGLAAAFAIERSSERAHASPAGCADAPDRDRSQLDKERAG